MKFGSKVFNRYAFFIKSINRKPEFIVVSATHDTSYQNDAGGIKASSRWLSEATPPVMRWG